PASAEEIEEAEEEGVTIQNSWGPRRILEKGGRALGIELVRCTSVFDKEGKFNPSFNEADRAQLETGGIIVAIGEEPDPSLFNGFIKHLAAEERMVITDHTGATSLPGVFAGGDIASPSHNIAQAIGDGKRGAVAIDSYLQKQDPTDIINRICVAGNGAISMVKYFHPEARARTPYVVAFSDLNTLYFDYSDRVPKIKLLPFERREGFEEVAFGVTEEMAMKEAGRCFSCGVCNECDNCYIFCPDISILKNANGLEHKIDYEYCKGCGICFVECPRYAFSLEVEQR
ncbi:MAG: FAD-dependent oxidoreductase, partial [Deltaproteobacteria bacterium]